MRVVVITKNSSVLLVRRSGEPLCRENLAIVCVAILAMNVDVSSLPNSISRQRCGMRDRRSETLSHSFSTLAYIYWQAVSLWSERVYIAQGGNGGC